MAYRRSVRRVASKSKRNLLITFILIIGLLYLAIAWILPNFINFLGSFNSAIKQPKEKTDDLSITLGPPVLNIPNESVNTSEIDIKGYANPNSKVKIFVDDQEVKIVDVTEDGSFNAQGISLALGTNNIYGKTIDENGKESLPSKTFKIIYDNEKPSLSISEPDDNKQIQGERKLKISGKTETGVQVFINNTQVIVDAEGNFSTIVSLNDGENNFNIKAQDSASNTEEVSRKVTYTP